MSSLTAARRAGGQAARPAHLLKTVDIETPIDWDGTPFTFALFTWEFVQPEAAPSLSVEHLCLARRVRHAIQLARVVGLVKIDTIDPTYYTVV